MAVAGSGTESVRRSDEPAARLVPERLHLPAGLSSPVEPDDSDHPAAVGEQLCARFFGCPPAANEATAIATALSGAQPTKPYKPGDGQNVAVSVVAQLLMHSAAFLTR